MTFRDVLFTKFQVYNKKTTIYNRVSQKLEEHCKLREELLRNERCLAIGASLTLTDKERRVNDLLMPLKLQEIDDGFKNPAQFLAGLHFFKSKPKIDQSKVFKIIQKLPKGSSLHSHDTALVCFDYLFSLTYKEDLYGCMTPQGRMKLHFFDQNNVPAAEPWKKISTYREEDPKFDEFLRTQMTLVVEDPLQKYPDINTIWKAFIDIFITVEPLVCYKPVFQEYFYQALKELHEDNVMYLEFRGLLPTVYDLEGKLYDPIEVCGLYHETLQTFLKDYPDFFGCKFIFAPLRCVDCSTVKGYKETFKKLKEKYPDFIGGFDLVAQEDLGEPLDKFIPELLDISDHAKFFFHAGETNWNGLSTDLNLVDAIILNTVRLGHAFAILKHPKLAEIVKERGIALELNPISNQVLKLVDDFRNHPGSILIANGYPVVVCCDDPCFWDAKALSYDWYVTFVGMASKSDDLRFLKQLAMNSIIYSALEEEEKKQLMKNWEKRWNKFIDDILGERNVEQRIPTSRADCNCAKKRNK